MKLLIDMNQSPLWVDYLKAHGVEAVHWSTIGDIRATDMVIMAWAREHGLVVYTHDLDFSALLAATGAAGPSVLQVRTQDILPSGIGADVVRVLLDHGEALDRGAIVTLDEVRARIRILPLQRGSDSGRVPG